jgi:hypothetical protein
MSLRESADAPAVGERAKMAHPLSGYGNATKLFATHKIIDSGKKAAEITKM